MPARGTLWGVALLAVVTVAGACSPGPDDERPAPSARVHRLKEHNAFHAQWGDAFGEASGRVLDDCRHGPGASCSTSLRVLDKAAGRLGAAIAPRPDAEDFRTVTDTIPELHAAYAKARPACAVAALDQASRTACRGPADTMWLRSVEIRNALTKAQLEFLERQTG